MRGGWRGLPSVSRDMEVPSLRLTLLLMEKQENSVPSLFVTAREAPSSCVKRVAASLVVMPCVFKVTASVSLSSLSLEEALLKAVFSSSISESLALSCTSSCAVALQQQQ
ncbi:hypothetical protein AGDE_16966 [Angomonas deanei]|nr:hypothetical protein AGDE_16966 [Angomonas deanei]|eukprot:EPY15792.1 hypothetical protein AGDE_16966 [Angomonas deanei]